MTVTLWQADTFPKNHTVMYEVEGIKKIHI